MMTYVQIDGRYLHNDRFASQCQSVVLNSPFGQLQFRNRILVQSLSCLSYSNVFFFAYVYSLTSISSLASNIAGFIVNPTQYSNFVVSLFSSPFHLSQLLRTVLIAHVRKRTNSNCSVFDLSSSPLRRYMAS